MFQCDFYIFDSIREIEQIISGDGTLCIPLCIFLTVLSWDFPPVRVVTFCFFLIWLDLFIIAACTNKRRGKRSFSDLLPLRPLCAYFATGPFLAYVFDSEGGYAAAREMKLIDLYGKEK